MKNEILFCFLVGCPRSGTSLLQRLLAEHPKVATLPETHFYRDLNFHLRSREGGSQPNNGLGGIRSRIFPRVGLATPNAVSRLNTTLKEIDANIELLNAKGLHSFNKVLGLYKAQLTRFARRQGALVILEKTPDHVNYIDRITTYHPAAKFIHIVRNGKDAIASLHDASIRFPQTHWGPRYSNLENCCARWNNATNDSLRYLSAPNHLHIRFENLVLAPDEAKNQMISFLELPLDNTKDVATSEVIRPEESWKNDVFAPIKKPADKFSHLFDDNQQAYILNQVTQIQQKVETLLPLSSTQSN